MPRADLLALTPDDLAAMTNRGTVKRAARELDAVEVSGDVTETDGTVTATWADGVTCVLPGTATLAAARCSCPATELCRHVIRTVLAYQRQSAAGRPADEPQPWNPGGIADADLARHFKPAALALALKQFEGGLLIEVVTGLKPTARFHDLACTIQFQVADDVRYVHCDCAAAPPCVHTPLAVWAFRRLPADQAAGLVSTQQKPMAVPTATLDRVEEALTDGLEFGLAGAGPPWRDRLVRLETECRAAGLIWPAEVLAEMVHEFERYAAHDAAFDPDAFADLMGELVIRCDAISRDTGAVPQLLIRGTAADRGTDLAGSRFVGLGCGVRAGQKAVTLTAYLQDANSGSLVAMSRAFAEAKDYWQLAQTPVVRGATFAQAGGGQLLTQGGRRTTGHELVLGRAKATVNPQNFAWESLRPPVLATGFADVRERLRILPPAALRPRRVGEDFHVCPVAAVERARFVSATQTVEAMLIDARGDRATLRHRYASRGRDGAERLLAALSASPVRFVAGPTRLTADGLCVEPTAVVLDGGVRTVIQPHVDRLTEARGGDRSVAGDVTPDPIESFGREWLAALGELLVVGLRRADARTAKTWHDLDHRAEALGLARLTAAASRPVARGLVEKAAIHEWKWRPTAAAALASAALSRLMRDLGVAATG